ncbi:MAG: hypothetical protein RLY97_399 [Pseudomonadota bacterium]|jgi:hypothetical protein
MKKWCFITHTQKELNECVLPPITLADDHAVALARLVPVLGCGEEAAALAFDGLAENCRENPAAQIALNLIAAEERIHERMMQSLSAGLPHIAEQGDILRRAQRLHIQLGVGSARHHLAKIAALDAAVCTVLSRLLRRNGPLAGDPVVYHLLSRIRRDEARHVALSRSLALATGNAADLRDDCAAARRALADILMLEAGAFETLGVDPAVLESDIGTLPNGLLIG